MLHADKYPSFRHPLLCSLRGAPRRCTAWWLPHAMSSERLVVIIGETKPNYKAAALPNGKTVFVKKSTMRHGPAAELAEGDEVELAIKVGAGREIITDAIRLPVGRPQAPPAPAASSARLAALAPEPEAAGAVDLASADAEGEAGSGIDVAQLRIREAELEAVVLIDRRILMAGGLQCGCGCGPDDAGYDPWAPQPAAPMAVGSFGVQQPKAAAHAEAKAADVMTRLELNQLELAELQAQLQQLDPQHPQADSTDSAAAAALGLAARVRGGSDDEPDLQPEPELEPPIYEDDDLIARPSTIEGLGLFAKRSFTAREVVLAWKPKVLTEEEFQTAGAIWPTCFDLSRRCLVAL